MKHIPTLIIDFDSTFVSVECLDQLAGIALNDRPDRQQLVAEIAAITSLGMEGKITFQESLSRRLSVIRPKRAQLQELNDRLKHLISPSITRHRAFFADHASDIFIISGGFKEFILPTTRHFGITDGHVLANSFRFDANGDYSGYDTDNPLAHSGGKTTAVRQLHVPEPAYVVGDSFTDWEIRRDGAAQTFIAFTENVRREAVVTQADAVARNFDDVLEHLKSASKSATLRATV